MRDEVGSKQFFITPSHDCSYLPGEQAQTLFLDPRETLDTRLYSALTKLGFRRSGSHVYRPHCQQCSACVPARVPVLDFKLKRRFRRALAANEDLRIEFVPAAYDATVYHLFERYITARHGDGDMYPPSPEQFRSFLLSPWCDTEFMTVWQEDRLVAVAVTDLLDDGLSAIYSFFDPELGNRSLGVYCVLKQIEAALASGLPYLYLGYWIRNSAKMHYKIDYRPIELLTRERWVRAS